MRKPTLLIIEDDIEFAHSLQRILRQDYEVQIGSTFEDANRLLIPQPDAVILDLRLSDDADNRDGIVILRKLRKDLPDVPVLMATGYGDVEIAIECMKLGAVDFIEKSRVDIREIRMRLAQALEKANLSRQNSDLKQRLSLIDSSEIIGNSEALIEIKKQIQAVASDAGITVLILGESGTGKELVAKAIHASGERKAKPFVDVVLAALSPQTIESELFGYEPGAFTDAKKRHIGYLEKSNGGVLFLDEIGELDSGIQIKLLRFLEERSFSRLGSTAKITVDVQVIAATNSDLRAKIANGTFREDLFYRLAAFEILIPPLRERKADILPIANHILKLFKRQGRKVKPLSEEAAECLKNYVWLGNGRELRNALERAMIRSNLHACTHIEPTDLPAEVRKQSPSERQIVHTELHFDFDLDESLAKAELTFVTEALKQTGGRKNEAWQLLGLNDRFALRRRINRIFKDYPHLLAEFALVKTLYHGDKNE